LRPATWRRRARTWRRPRRCAATGNPRAAQTRLLAAETTRLGGARAAGRELREVAEQAAAMGARLIGARARARGNDLVSAPDPKLTALLRRGSAAGRRCRRNGAARLRPPSTGSPSTACARRGGHTLQPTALVHEAWMRHSAERESGWQNREQFFAVAAKTMRHLLVDPPGGGGRQAWRRRPMAARQLADVIASPLPDQRLLDLNAALDQLAALDERQARIVELRFFAGLSIEETAGVLTLSASTVKRMGHGARLALPRSRRNSARLLLVARRSARRTCRVRRGSSTPSSPGTSRPGSA
jgi:RNA polymerase sigma factor (TIGR02999 family)